MTVTTSTATCVIYLLEQPSTYLTTPTCLSLTSTIIRGQLKHGETIAKAKSYSVADSQVKKQSKVHILTLPSALLSQQGPRYCPRKEVSPSPLNSTHGIYQENFPVLLPLIKWCETWELVSINNIRCMILCTCRGLWKEPAGVSCGSTIKVFFCI